MIIRIQASAAYNMDQKETISSTFFSLEKLDFELSTAQPVRYSPEVLVILFFEKGEINRIQKILNK